MADCVNFSGLFCVAGFTYLISLKRGIHFYFICMRALTCVQVCTMYVRCPWCAEEGAGLAGTELTDCCEPPFR